MKYSTKYAARSDFFRLKDSVRGAFMTKRPWAFEYLLNLFIQKYFA